MKSNVLRFMASIIFVLMCLFFSFKSAKAEDVYLGEFCWQVFDEAGAPDWVYKFGVYQKEGGHLVFYGTSRDSFTEVAHGNAEIVGAEVKMVIVGSGVGSSSDPNYVWSDTFVAVLDISTLNGTWHVLGLDHDDVEGTNTDYINGTISLIICP